MPILTGYGAYGTTRWRQGSDSDLNVAVMGTISPIAYLLTGRVDDTVLVCLIVVGLAITIAWRIQLLRHARCAVAAGSQSV